MEYVALPEGYRPTMDEPYMGPLQLAYFRKLLLDWRAELEAETEKTYARLKADREKDSEATDRGTREAQMAFELKTRDRYRKLMKKIDSALARIEAGTYGYCEETEEPIGIRRLEARPVATLSIEAQERHEQAEKVGLA